MHAWTDHVAGSDNQGHLAHINAWIRTQPATWISGSALTTSVGAATFDVATTSGLVLQLHDHTMPAFDTSTGSDVYIVNDNTTSYKKVGDLTGETTDASGGSMAGDWYHLVIWGAVNEATGDCKIFCNLPTSSYNNNNGDQAVNDTESTAVYDIPVEFRGVGFLISRLLISETGGTFTEQANIDLRGLYPTTGAGGSEGGGVSTWTELTDTPSSYTAQAYKIPQVASGETALEFTDSPTVATTNMTEGTDKNFVTDAEAVVIGNTSGTNTGDEFTESFIIAIGDETTAATTGTAKTTFRMPYAFTLTDIRAHCVTAPTGATLTLDVNESGSTILSTKLTIDSTEKTSETAATQPVISDSALADDSEITIDIDQIGSTVAGAGIKITLIGHQ